MVLCKCYIRTWSLRGGQNGDCEHRKVRLGSLQTVGEEAALYFPLEPLLDDCAFPGSVGGGIAML